MTVDVTAGPSGDRVLDNSFVRELEGLYVPWTAEPVPAPALLALNDDLALELGFDPAALRTREGLDFLTGHRLPAGATPVAQAYAGHQFGGYSPRLGDGRALLLGELVDASGRRRDLHLKGSGRTPFARGGDGKAAVGPMLREYVIGEAMHALGIPTTRALAVVATGETVARDFPLPGAVLARIAASHLRVGTFQFAASTGEEALFQRLVDHAIGRHHPSAAEAANPALALYEAVVDAQASLVARWMLVGFVHGVMNTDNMTISGETIDYGPCAFMEAYDPETVFSSIDHGGRYAFGNQPVIAQWNLARLAETLLPLFGDEQQQAIDVATEVLTSFMDRFESRWRAGMRDKLGLVGQHPGEDALVDELLALMHSHGADFTSVFRSLASYLRGERGVLGVMVEAWAARWSDQVVSSPRDASAVANEMDRVNPLYIPRNHLVEAALDAATAGDLAPFERLVDVVTRPFEARPGLDEYTRPAPPELGRYRTFCGT